MDAIALQAGAGEDQHLGTDGDSGFGEQPGQPGIAGYFGRLPVEGGIQVGELVGGGAGAVLDGGQFVFGETLGMGREGEGDSRYAGEQDREGADRVSGGPYLGRVDIGHRCMEA